MVIGAIAKAAAKGAAKSAAKKSVKARAAKAGDVTYNARRRYTRAAERNLKKAEQSTGATSARYRHMATEELKRAVATYDKGTTQKMSSSITNLASQLGVDIEQIRDNLKSLSDDRAKSVQSKLVESSKSHLESNLRDYEERRQKEARAILSNDEIGSRILGGTVNIWRDAATVNGKVDKKKILPALYKHFGVDNLADLLSKVEDLIGDTLYADPDSEVMYETVKLTIQRAVKDNSVVE